MVTKTGGCKFCGQMVQFEVPDKAYSLEDLDILATHNCTCPDAIRERKIQKAIAEAHGSIDEIFALDEPERVCLKSIVTMVGTGKFDSVSIKMDNRTKVGIKMTSKGNIRIDKSITSVETRES